MCSQSLDYDRQTPCQPLVAGRQEVYKALNWFKDILKTESAFYIHFQTLSPEHRHILRTFWHLSDDYILFGHICNYWSVKVA